MQQGRGELVEVAAEVVEMAACDGQDVGRVERAHVGANHERATPTRAKQSIPPALRRRVMRRDGGRCQVPGCRHAVFTDVHHLQARSEGGANALENLVTLCSAHHRAIHRGALVVVGTAWGRLVFRHADGVPYGASGSGKHADVPYGASRSGTSAELRAKARRALTRMGYRETEARRAVDQLPACPDESLERVVRVALRELTAGSARSLERTRVSNALTTHA
jgi:hypothetical protein